MKTLIKFIDENGLYIFLLLGIKIVISFINIIISGVLLIKQRYYNQLSTTDDEHQTELKTIIKISPFNYVNLNNQVWFVSNAVFGLSYKDIVFINKMKQSASSLTNKKIGLVCKNVAALEDYHYAYTPIDFLNKNTTKTDEFEIAQNCVYLCKNTNINMLLAHFRKHNINSAAIWLQQNGSNPNMLTTDYFNNCVLDLLVSNPPKCYAFTKNSYLNEFEKLKYTYSADVNYVLVSIYIFVLLYEHVAINLYNMYRENIIPVLVEGNPKVFYIQDKYKSLENLEYSEKTISDQKLTFFQSITTNRRLSDQQLF